MSKYKYALDLTGTLAANKIINEGYTLGTGTAGVIHGPNNHVILLNGPAHLNNFLVTNEQNNKKVELNMNTDYVLVNQCVSTTRNVERITYAGILITNPNIKGQLNITYQTIGGPYGVGDDKEIILDILTGKLGEVKFSWEELTSKPDFIIAGKHVVDINKLRGFEGVIESLDTLTSAFLNGKDSVKKLDFENFQKLVLDQLGGLVQVDKTGYIPTGTMLSYSGTNPPTGYFLCDGSVKNKNEEPDLFKVLGYKYSKTSTGVLFNIPNRKGSVSGTNYQGDNPLEHKYIIKK